MIKIEINEHMAEDFKDIQELKKTGVPEEIIQKAYNETQRRRKEGEDDGQESI